MHGENNFKILNTSKTSSARRGLLSTAHGEIQTPFFMPIATKGAVKTLSSFDMEGLKAQILLSNTYHLYLRPGMEVIKNLGGLHRFMDWPGPILTDSGGYQVFSLASRRKITEEGAEFASHIDGSKHLLTPELSMDVQQNLGSDIVMVLDECTPPDYDEKALNNSITRTVRWAERSKKHFEQNLSTSNNPGALLFGINQGAIDRDLRVRHAKDLIDIGFDGFAIGGLSVGEPFEEACDVLDALHPVLPADKPRYFMGGAKPHEIVAYVKRGVDMMDCVLPSRNARHGLLYRFVHDDLSRPDFYEAVHITNSKYAQDKMPLSTDGDELNRYSFAYLHHLFSVQEMLAYRLATMVNIKFYLELMRRIRQEIEAGNF